MIGRSDVWYYNNEHRERSWWIGKPWRRVELLVQDYWYRGDLVDRSWEASVHVGARRLGWHGGLTIGKAQVLDYSEEEHQ